MECDNSIAYSAGAHCHKILGPGFKQIVGFIVKSFIVMHAHNLVSTKKTKSLWYKHKTLKANHAWWNEYTNDYTHEYTGDDILENTNDALEDTNYGTNDACFKTQLMTQMKTQMKK